MNAIPLVKLEPGTAVRPRPDKPRATADALASKPGKPLGEESTADLLGGGGGDGGGGGSGGGGSGGGGSGGGGSGGSGGGGSSPTGSAGRAAMNRVAPVWDAADNSLRTCSICFEDLEPGEYVRQLRCVHLFHQECIDQWLSHKNACPNCNERVIVRGTDGRRFSRTGGAAAVTAAAASSPAAVSIELV